MHPSSKFANRVDILIRFFLYVLIFWLPYSKAVVEICVIVGAALWLVKRTSLFLAKRGEGEASDFLESFKPASSCLTLPIGLFLVACVISISGSLFWQSSLRAFFTKTLEWFAIYFLVVEVFNRKKHVWTALIIFVFTAFSTAVDGLVQYYLTHRDVFMGYALTEGYRVTAGFSHANGLGAFFTMAIPVTLSFAMIAWHSFRLRAFLWAAFAVMVWAFLLTFSRASWFAVLASVLFMSLFWLKKAIASRLIVLLFVICLGMTGYFKLTTTAADQRLRPQNISASLGWRLAIWKDSLQMIKDRPFFGHGINSYMKLFQEYRRRRGGEGGGVYSPTYAHNSYLQLAAETGLAGLSAFALILGTLMCRATKAYRKFVKGHLPREGGLFLGLMGGCVAYFTQSIFDVDFYSLQLVALIWYMIGVLISMQKLLCNSDGCDI